MSEDVSVGIELVVYFSHWVLAFEALVQKYPSARRACYLRTVPSAVEFGVCECRGEVPDLFGGAPRAARGQARGLRLVVILKLLKFTGVFVAILLEFYVFGSTA